MARPISPLTAADVMTSNPRTCSTFSTVLEAVLIFRDADCGAVPVLKDGKPVGVLTDRDAALSLADHPDELSRLPVSEIMSEGVISVRTEAPLDELIDQLADRKVRRLLVVDASDRLVGIIAWADIARYLPESEVGRVVTEVVESP